MKFVKCIKHPTEAYDFTVGKYYKMLSTGIINDKGRLQIIIHEENFKPLPDNKIVRILYNV